LTKKMPNLFFQFLANSIKYTFLNYGDKHQWTSFDNLHSLTTI
jgi:hypothetical protein